MGFPERDMAAVVDHGGSLDRARTLFPDAPEPWVDLSTGINPHSYPLFDLPATALARLPEPARVGELSVVAAETYGAPDGGCVAAAPGTQLLLPRIYALAAPGRAMVLGPTYAEHARTAALCGHAVTEVRDFDDLAQPDIAIVVNPNNPNGHVTPRSRLLDLASALRRRGGLLVVDEAFMDVGRRAESLCGDVADGNIVVLRSFGKFFGLAGLRLGFAVAAPVVVARLVGELGPWAVSGPALEYGLRALADKPWQEAMRLRLDAEAGRLDDLLRRNGVAVDGGTSLFRHVTSAAAPDLFTALGGRGILVRCFADRPRELRFGLPGSGEAWRRLAAALETWRRDHGAGVAE